MQPSLVNQGKDASNFIYNSLTASALSSFFPPHLSHPPILLTAGNWKAEGPTPIWAWTQCAGRIDCSFYFQRDFSFNEIWRRWLLSLLKRVALAYGVVEKDTAGSGKKRAKSKSTARGPIYFVPVIFVYDLDCILGGKWALDLWNTKMYYLN